MTTLQIFQSADPHDRRLMGVLAFAGGLPRLLPSAAPPHPALGEALAEIGSVGVLQQLRDDVDAAGVRTYTSVEVGPSDPAYPFAVASHLLSHRGWRCEVEPGPQDEDNEDWL